MQFGNKIKTRAKIRDSFVAKFLEKHTFQLTCDIPAGKVNKNYNFSIIKRK